MEMSEKKLNYYCVNCDCKMSVILQYTAIPPNYEVVNGRSYRESDGYIRIDNIEEPLPSRCPECNELIPDTAQGELINEFMYDETYWVSV